MRKLYLVFSFFVLFLLSCNKDNFFIAQKIKSIEKLNGSYTGNIYKWNRDYDSTHVNVIETFDTIRNVKSTLEIDVKNNSIRFNNSLYDNHKDLNLLLDNDTIIAANGYNNPSSIMIIKSRKFFRVYFNKGVIGSPWAYSITEEYFKD